MGDPVIETKFDMAIEEHAMRKQGMIGRGNNSNQVFAMSYDSLPPEAKTTINRIISGGPFDYPGKDGSSFGNKFGDLPEGKYLEYTVKTPGARNRGARRIVARKTTGQIFFTACHYERVGVSGVKREDRAAVMETATAAVDEQWRNGFCVVTGMSADLRNDLVQAIKGLG